MSQKDPVKISVVMPCYNAETFVGLTIESVIKQSFENWELIIVDDCSTDRTRDVVNSYMESDSRILMITLRRNTGAPAKPRNIGIRASKGSMIALLDADDIWHPKKLDYQLRIMQKLCVDFCSTGMVDFTGAPPSLNSPPKNLRVEQITLVKQKIKGRIPASSVLAKKKLLAMHPFSEDPRYKAVEDYHCWLRIHESIGHSVKIKFPFLFYRRRGGQISGSKMYMLKHMYMLHREYPAGTIFGAAFFSFTYIIGAIYYRILKKGL